MGKCELTLAVFNKAIEAAFGKEVPSVTAKTKKRKKT